jgi:AcrR family transcriptional regulator
MPPGRASAPDGRAKKILSGAARVFSARGFAATSMRGVARETGASLGSIYHHFGSKDGLLQAIMVGNFRRVRAALEEELCLVDDPRESIRIFVTNHVTFFARHLDEMRVMSHELDTLTGSAGEEVRALRNSYTDRAAGFLRELRPDLRRDELQLATLCLFGTLNWTYRWFHAMPSTADVEALGSQMAELFLCGFEPPRA